MKPFNAGFFTLGKYLAITTVETEANAALPRKWLASELKQSSAQAADGFRMTPTRGRQYNSFFTGGTGVE